MAKQFVNLAIGDRGWPKVRTKLDGVTFSLEAIWNEVELAWMLSLYDVDGELLRAGLTLRHAVDVLAPFPDANMPGGGVGQLGAWDTGNRQDDPGRTSLARSSAVRLVYIPAADVLAAS